MNVRYNPAARREVEEAAEWYESQKGGLGDEFLSEYDVAIQVLTGAPRVFRVIPVPGSHREIRRCLVDRFPYQIIYEIVAEEIVILAVAHIRRKPFYWKGRTP